MIGKTHGDLSYQVHGGSLSLFLTCWIGSNIHVQMKTTKLHDSKRIKDHLHKTFPTWGHRTAKIFNLGLDVLSPPQNRSLSLS